MNFDLSFWEKICNISLRFGFKSRYTKGSDGGIGRRAGLKIPFTYVSVGSIPTPSTKKHSIDLNVFLLHLILRIVSLGPNTLQNLH